MAILESVKELASKLGAETNGRDITDQLNKINKHLDEAALSGRDIAEAVKTYSENASGGGGSEAFNVTLTIDNTFSIVEASETFSTVFPKVINGDYVKFTFSSPNESVPAAGYFLSQNDSTHENEALLIVLQALVLGNKNSLVCFKWYADNTFSSMLTLEELTPPSP